MLDEKWKDGRQKKHFINLVQFQWPALGPLVRQG